MYDVDNAPQTTFPHQRMVHGVVPDKKWGGARKKDAP